MVAGVQSGAAPGEVGRDVMARIMSADGRPLSPVFEVGIDADAYDEQEHVEIAALAGHAIEKSQAAYAGKRSGWGIDTVDRAEPGRAEALEAKAAERLATRKAASESVGERNDASDDFWPFDDMPAPKAPAPNPAMPRRNGEAMAAVKKWAGEIARSTTPSPR